MQEQRIANRNRPPQNLIDRIKFVFSFSLIGPDALGLFEVLLCELVRKDGQRDIDPCDVPNVADGRLTLTRSQTALQNSLPTDFADEIQRSFAVVQ